MTRRVVAERSPWQAWLKRLGVAGFLFFLIKGLLWLTAVALVVFFGFQLGAA
ncbi:MAG: hypothetical protein ACE5LB_11905 [Acidiferrobacterales bacterium]